VQKEKQIYHLSFSIFHLPLQKGRVMSLIFKFLKVVGMRNENEEVTIEWKMMNREFNFEVQPD